MPGTGWPGGPIALTTAEIRRLFTGLIITPCRDGLATPARSISHIQRWSSWRRLHQGHARRSHYQHSLPPISAHNEMTLPS